MNGIKWTVLAGLAVLCAGCGDDSASTTGSGGSGGEGGAGTGTGTNTSTDTTTFTGTGTGTNTGTATGTNTVTGTGTGTGVANTCDGACDTCEEAHGVVGCCDGTTLVWFDGGMVGGGDCGAQGCGWDQNAGWYECGFSGDSGDPAFPIACGTPWEDTEGLCAAPTCVGSCGGQAPSGCYCDDECVDFGDCCPDICDAGVCDSDPAICPGPECACDTGAVTDPACSGSDATACVCDPCVDNGTCDPTEDCVCADCAADPICSDAAACNGDGLCNPVLEGCACADCAGHPTCPAGGATCPGGVPITWACNPAFYDVLDGCDCDCGAHDPDCDVAGQTLFCNETKPPPGTTCDAMDECVTP